MSISVGLIIFSIIDQSVVDVLDDYHRNFDAQFKFAISVLVISTPIFYLSSSLIQKGLKNGELAKDSGVRRWLTYLITLASSLVILGVFVSIINNFLSGELTLRIILESLTVFVLSSLAFSFYLYSIKRNDVTKKDGVIKFFLIVSLALIVAAFVSSLFFVESPQKTRERRLDDVVVQNISNLESYVNNYYDRYHKLPADLDELREAVNMYNNRNPFINPNTNQAIVYNKVNDKSFEFCTDFKTNSRENGGNMRYMVMGDKSHEAGYQCLSGALWGLDREALIK